MNEIYLYQCTPYVTSFWNRERLLEQIHDKLKSQQDNDPTEDVAIHLDNVIHACAEFKTDAHIILGLSQRNVEDLVRFFRFNLSNNNCVHN